MVSIALLTGQFSLSIRYSHSVPVQGGIHSKAFAASGAMYSGMDIIRRVQLHGARLAGGPSAPARAPASWRSTPRTGTPTGRTATPAAPAASGTPPAAAAAAWRAAAAGAPASRQMPRPAPGTASARVPAAARRGGPPASAPTAASWRHNLPSCGCASGQPPVPQQLSCGTKTLTSTPEPSGNVVWPSAETPALWLTTTARRKTCRYGMESCAEGPAASRRQYLREILPIDACGYDASAPQAEQRAQLRLLPSDHRQPRLGLLCATRLAVLLPRGKCSGRHADAPSGQQHCGVPAVRRAELGRRLPPSKRLCQLRLADVRQCLHNRTVRVSF